MSLLTKKDVIKILTQPIINAICHKKDASEEDFEFEIYDKEFFKLKITPLNPEMFPNGIVIINTEGYNN